MVAMQAKAQKAQASLEAGTRALDAGQRKLADLQRRADKTRSDAEQAEAVVKQRREEVSAYAASVYRNQAPSGLTGLLVLDSVDTTADGDGGSSVLKAAGYLDHVSRSQADVLRQVRVEGQRAQVLRRQADELVRAADQEKKALEVKVKQLQDQAARDAAELEQAVKEYEAAKAAAEKEARERAEAARRAAIAKAEAEAKARAAALAKQRAARAIPPRAAAPALVLPPSQPSSGGAGCHYTGGGGYPNGMLPASALCPLASAPGHRLRGDAAAAFDQMSAAFAQAFGHPICVTDSYRSYAEQVDVYRRKPNLAAIPGRSNHGWGLAADLGCGIQNFGSPQYRWMKANAAKFGWFHPGWAEPNGSKPEPWHWEFGRIS
jgi:LAS superfamily LD-carboxypeptidase LdcB